MGVDSQYRRADQSYSPRMEGADPDEEPPEEFMFDVEDELAGTTEGNMFVSRRKRIIRICIYVVMGSLIIVGLGALSVFVLRANGGFNPTPNGVEGEGDETEAEPEEMKRYSYEILEKYYHDPEAFTQGLFFHDGYMYESDGIYDQSKIRYYTLDSQKDEKTKHLTGKYFGEGCAIVGSSVLQITWKSGKGFKYDHKTLKPTGEWSYSGEGWGITTNDDESIVYMTSGTDEIQRLDPHTLEESMDRLVVLDNYNTSRNMLNELEFINGEIWSNVWQTDEVLRIDPETGKVNSIIDFKQLLQPEDIGTSSPDVLNGIAYDKDTDSIYVTGKRWPTMYKVKIV